MRGCAAYAPSIHKQTQPQTKWNAEETDSQFQLKWTTHFVPCLFYEFISHLDDVALLRWFTISFGGVERPQNQEYTHREI